MLFENCYSQNAVQDILNKYTDSISNYGIIALVDNGEIIKYGEIGFNYGEIKLKVDNRFCIGSVSKMFTSTIVLKLNELKLLNLNDSIGKYGFNTNFIDSSITIKHLLNHTSGLKEINGTELLNKSLTSPYSDFSDGYLFSKIDKIDFKKGTKYSYCNTNYMILKSIIERVTDKPIEFSIIEYIFKPTNMRNSYPFHSNQIDNISHPIIYKQDFHSIPKLGVNKISKGVGNIVCTPEDLNKFLRALLIDRIILNEKSIELMSDFKKSNNSYIGLGLFKEIYKKKTVMGHTGRTISYITYAFVDMESKTSYVIYTNNLNDEYIDEIFKKIIEL